MKIKTDLEVILLKRNRNRREIYKFLQHYSIYRKTNKQAFSSMDVILSVNKKLDDRISDIIKTLTEIDKIIEDLKYE